MCPGSCTALSCWALLPEEACTLPRGHLGKCLWLSGRLQVCKTKDAWTALRAAAPWIRVRVDQLPRHVRLRMTWPAAFGQAAQVARTETTPLEANPVFLNRVFVMRLTESLETCPSVNLHCNLFATPALGTSNAGAGRGDSDLDPPTPP